MDPQPCCHTLPCCSTHVPLCCLKALPSFQKRTVDRMFILLFSIYNVSRCWPGAATFQKWTIKENHSCACITPKLFSKSSELFTSTQYKCVQNRQKQMWFTLNIPLLSYLNVCTNVNDIWELFLTQSYHVDLEDKCNLSRMDSFYGAFKSTWSPFTFIVWAKDPWTFCLTS